MTSRWDHLFDQKPLPLLEQLLEQVSRLLSKELSRWPLTVQEFPADAGESALRLMQGLDARPSPAVFKEAFRLARWELEHALEAYDDYMRNQRFLARGLSASDKPALLFISRWMLEQMTSLREATEGRVKRDELLECLSRTQRAAGFGTTEV